MKFLKLNKLLCLVALCLVAVLAFSACAPAGVNTNAASAKGEWGDIKWEYDSASKTLTLSGSGDMNTMVSSDECPWAAVNMSAEKLVVKEGITSICDYAFYGFGALKTAELPEGKRYDTNTVFVIGGSTVYEQLLPYCDTAYVTKVDNEKPADKFFPNLEESSDWKMVCESENMEHNGVNFKFTTYRSI